MALNGGNPVVGQTVIVTRTPDPGGTTVDDQSVLSLGEVTILGSSDLGDDSDADGMPDLWEIANGLTVGTDDSGDDADSDGLTNLEEYENVTNPQVADSDMDGVNDGAGGEHTRQ